MADAADRRWQWITIDETADRRAEMISLLDDAMTIAEGLRDGVTAHLIERAIDQARAEMSGRRGKVRAAKVTKERRSEIAHISAAKRWKK